MSLVSKRKAIGSYHRLFPSNSETGDLFMPYRYLPIFEPLVFTMTNSYTFYIICNKDYFKYFAELWICWSKLDITKNSSNLLIFSKLHGTIPATALGKTWDTNWREQTREVPTNWCFRKVSRKINFHFELVIFIESRKCPGFCFHRQGNFEGYRISCQRGSIKHLHFVAMVLLEAMPVAWLPRESMEQSQWFFFWNFLTFFS